MVKVRETSAGLTFAVKVQPRARKNTITGVVGDALKLSLTAPPIEGRANEAVIRFFADLFEIPRSSVTIASGATSQRKVLRITGLSKPAVEERLERHFSELSVFLSPRTV
ncbi:MAG TPA: DUF167 domain-containing protein [Terriglobales bacterium]